MKRNAFAKINLTLDVLNKRDDGYHDIVSLMQSVSLCDVVTLSKADSGIEVSWNIDETAGERNTAYRAAKRLMDKYNVSGGVKIHIDKSIPISAGLGGGSADAAAVIEGLNELLEVNAERSELLALGAEIGADVPFCMTNGAVVAEGIGDRLVKLDTKMQCHVVLIKPGISVSTKEAYEKLDSISLKRRPNMRMTTAAVKAGDVKNLGQNLYNVMEVVTASEFPIITMLKKEMTFQGAAGTLMSGSGPTVYGIFENSIQAENAYRFFKNKYENYDIFICKFYYP